MGGKDDFSSSTDMHAVFISYPCQFVHASNVI